MNNILRKIYQNILAYEKDVHKTEDRITEEIEKIIEPLKEKLNATELEELKNLMYQTSLTAEQEGFQLGMRYLLKLFLTLLAD